MKKVRKPSPTESPLLFEISPEPIPETLTALGGVPLLVQAFRSLGLPARVREHVRIKERDRGYDEATMVESFVVLNAVGGECCDDFERLREDPGLSELIGHGVPSLAVARKFLNQFHAEEKIEAAKAGWAGLGEPGLGAGVGAAVPGSAHRDGGSGCDGRRGITGEQEAVCIAHLRRRAGLPADAGG